MANQVTMETVALEARGGNKITYKDVSGKEKTLWAGLGNRSGLHSYANEIIEKKWQASGARMLKKLANLPDGTKITIHIYRNVTRDRGKWMPLMNCYV